jgi:N-acetylmuramoyl-L-alanine amidase
MDEQKLIKHAAINSFVLMLMIVLMSSVYSYYNDTLIYAENDNEKVPNIFNPNENMNTLTPNENNDAREVISKNLGNKYLIIKKSNPSVLDINLDDLYMERSINLTISGLSKDDLDKLSIIRVNEGKEFIGQPILSDDVSDEQSNDDETKSDNNIVKDKGNNSTKEEKSADIESEKNTDIAIEESSDLSSQKNTDIAIEKNTDIKSDRNASTVLNHNTNQEEQLLIPEIITASGEIISANDITNLEKDMDAIDPVKEFNIHYDVVNSSEKYTATIYISLDNIYTHIIYQDAENIYIDLRRPKEVYEKIVVIDAGHGGKDSGTYSRDELNYEKDINLSILLKLKEILDKESFKVYYTRTTDKTIFLNPRVNFANDVEADLFLSIHCNASESPEPYGSEVLYNELDNSEEFNSKRLAEICFEEIKALTKRVNRGLVYGNEMVIIGKANMPVALAEIGFMSNQQDLDFLLQESNQKDIAEALHKTILRSFEESESYR